MTKKQLAFSIASLMAIGSLPSMAAIPSRSPAPSKKPVISLADRVKQNLSEDQVYVQVIQSYRIRDLDKLEKSTTAFVNAYPASPFADNALYLRGQLYLQNQKYAEAIRNFKTITEQYPRGNKVVSALFAKGQAYKKLNLFEFAEKSFRQVKKDFPGSPEAERCDIELKLIQIRRKG